MDSSTQRILHEISLKASLEAKNLIERKKDDTAGKAVKEYLNWQKSTHRMSKKDDSRKIKHLEELQKKGAFNPVISEQTNPQVQKRIQQSIDYQMREKIRSGELKPPKQDGFIRMLQNHRKRYG